MKKTIFLLLPIAFLAACSVDKSEVKEEIKTDVTQEIIQEGTGSEDKVAETEVPEEGAVVETMKNKKEKELDQLDLSMESLKKQGSEGSQAVMVQAQTEVYLKWQEQLDTLELSITEKMSDSEKEAFTADKMLWEKHRDMKVVDSAVEFAGGSMEALQMAITKKQLTKERAYEMAKKYFK